MGFKRKDHYYRKAKKEGYLSRAAYKLEEINGKFRLVRRGDCVVDVGCAPGGWSQVLLDIVGKEGLVIGIDVLDTCRVRAGNFHFLHLDVTDPACVEEVLRISGGKVDAVLSDAAPNTTGIKMTDHARSVCIAETVVDFSLRVLKEGGNLCVKVFEGPDVGVLVSRLKEHFGMVKRFRPGATRKESFEIYLSGSGFSGSRATE